MSRWVNKFRSLFHWVEFRSESRLLPLSSSEYKAFRPVSPRLFFSRPVCPFTYYIRSPWQWVALSTSPSLFFFSGPNLESAFFFFVFFYTFFFRIEKDRGGRRTQTDEAQRRRRKKDLALFRFMRADISSIIQIQSRRIKGKLLTIGRHGIKRTDTQNCVCAPYTAI